MLKQKDSSIIMTKVTKASKMDQHSDCPPYPLHLPKQTSSENSINSHLLTETISPLDSRWRCGASHGPLAGSRPLFLLGRNVPAPFHPFCKARESVRSSKTTAENQPNPKTNNHQSMILSEVFMKENIGPARKRHKGTSSWKIIPSAT